MALVIPITGVAADFRVPGSYAEVIFAQGPASAAAPTREVVLAMPMISTGTWTAGTLYPVISSQVAELGGGAGSPIHRAARLFLRANKNARLWALPVAETSGGSPVAATGTVSFASAASAQGTVTVTICGEDATYTFKNGDTPASIATGIAAVINGKTWLPITATPVALVVTLTAKLKGISQGTAALGVIRFRAAITAGVTTTVTTSGAALGTAVAGAEGSTPESTNLTTALANIVFTRKYYIVSSANDTTSLTALNSHIATKSLPRQGLRSVGIAAYTGTLANAQTLAIAQNYERLAIAWQKNSEHDTAEIAANLAAIRQLRESVDSAYIFNGYNGVGNGWFILPAYNTADNPTADDQNDGINAGLTVIASNDTSSYIVMSCTTRSKTAAGGTIPDFRVTRSHIVSVCDEFTDETLIDFALNYASKKFKDDEYLANGQVNTNQRRIRGVVVPSMLAAGIRKRMDDYYTQGKLQNIDATKASIRTVKSNARAEIGFDLQVIDPLDQSTIRIAEISTG